MILWPAINTANKKPYTKRHQNRKDVVEILNCINKKCYVIIAFIALIWTINLLGKNYHYHQSAFFRQKSLTTLTRSIDKQVIAVNKKIAENRTHLLILYRKFQHHQAIGPNAVNWLEFLSKNYIFFNPYNPKEWKKLINSIDEIPPELVITQATLASNAGTNYLATHGNNFFGTVVSKAEFGLPELIVPRDIRQQNWLTPNNLQYTQYPTPEIAIEDYMWMLNINKQYKNFRAQRAKHRDAKLPLATWHPSHSSLRNTKASNLATDNQYGAMAISYTIWNHLKSYI